MSDTSESRTIDVFCTDCNVQVAACVVATHGKCTPQSGFEMIAIDDLASAPYDVVECAIAVCGRCESVFLVESTCVEIEGTSTLPRERILYPSSRRISMDGVPATVVRAYSNAARSFSVGLYEPCVIMSRKCIEAVCEELGTTKGNLKERLSILGENGKIDQNILAWANQLRLIGNDAAHDLKIVIEQIDARDALDFVEAILMYVFTLNRKFEEFLERRKNLHKQQ